MRNFMYWLVRLLRDYEAVRKRIINQEIKRRILGKIAGRIPREI